MPARHAELISARFLFFVQYADMIIERHFAAGLIFADASSLSQDFTAAYFPRYGAVHDILRRAPCAPRYSHAHFAMRVCIEAGY